MRELKFRAWDKDKKQFTNSIDGVSLDGQILKLAASEYGISNMPTNVELMQYTGIKDKNGTEIYEGDLLKWHDDILEVRWVGVGWDLFSKLFKRFGLPNGSTCGTTNTLGYTRKSEIIGNIYQNPELLEEQQ